MTANRRGTVVEDPSPNQSYCWDRSSYDNSSIYSEYIGDSIDEAPNEKECSLDSKLPPQDGGRRAWTVLMAGFVIEAILWGEHRLISILDTTILTRSIAGIPQSFGVFQEYYLIHEQFKGDGRVILIGVLASGLPDIGAPLMTYIVEKFPRYRLLMMWLGWPICFGALIAASFVKTVPLLIITQGLVYGIGELVFFYPLLSLVNEWWHKRMGLAYGILDCSTGLVGIPLPFLIDFLLKKYGYEWTLRILCIGAVAITGPCLFFIKGRVPSAEVQSTNIIDWSFLKKPLFYFYSLSNVFQSFGWFIPLMFLPTYASDLELSEEMGALLISCISLASIGSCLLLGHLSDGRVSLNLLAFTSSFVIACAVFLFWGFAHTLAFLIALSIIFSSFGAGWEVLWARMSTSVTNNPGAIMTSFGILSCQRGVANVLAGVISPYLTTGAIVEYEYGMSKYMPLVLFTGSALLLSALTIVAWYLVPRKVRERSKPAVMTDEVNSLPVLAEGQVTLRHFAVARQHIES